MLNPDGLQPDTLTSHSPEQFAARAQQVTGPMPLYWLCYHHNNQISVVIEPGASFIQNPNITKHARE
jgi:hypothetical protein